MLVSSADSRKWVWSAVPVPGPNLSSFPGPSLFRLLEGKSQGKLSHVINLCHYPFRKMTAFLYITPTILFQRYVYDTNKL